MQKKIGSLNGLRIFEVAGRKMSFTRAAEELHLTQGAVSYQIRELELRLGLKLFHREIRKVTLTEAGEQLHKVTRRALRAIDNEIHALTTNQKPMTLTVAVSNYVATKWLSYRLNGFLEANPDTVLQLQHAVNTPDFELGMYDLAIRWGKSPWKNARSRELLPMDMFPVCAPSLLQGSKGLRQPKDLYHATLLRDQENVDLWPAWFRKAEIFAESIGIGRTIADPVVRTQAAVDGQGVMLADNLVADELSRGDLVIPFNIALEGYGYHILWAQDMELSLVATEFYDWILTQL
ncbi:MAG: LysR family transcriptional regulator [Gammaproteobacteria bacterium]|nr:LysR family transcriptional regulator [Gammaproteobacteria bacterium]